MTKIVTKKQRKETCCLFSLFFMRSFSDRLSPKCLRHGLRHSASDDGTCQSFNESLNSDQQDDEHERIRSAKHRDTILYIICLIEHQDDIAHEKKGVEHGRQKTGDKITDGFRGIDLMKRAEYPAGACADEGTHDHTENEGMDRADLEEERGHNRTAAYGIIQAGETIYSAKYAADKRTA